MNSCSGAKRIRVADLAGLVPSVTFSQNTGFAQLTIRGIGTNAIFAGSDPSSAVYLDGVYLARPAGVLGDFLDLERVEVLRGPQGTLYGRNVVGGAINLITNLPTNERTLSTRVVLGNFQTARAEVNLSGPIVPGRIMASVSVLRGVSDGFVRGPRSSGEAAWRNRRHGDAGNAARSLQRPKRASSHRGLHASRSGAALLREGARGEAGVHRR